MQFFLDLPGEPDQQPDFWRWSVPAARPHRTIAISGSAEYGVNYGNHVATVITYEPDRQLQHSAFPGLFTATNLHGRGFGDMNFSNNYLVSDIRTSTGSVEDVLYSQNAKYSSAFDINGDRTVRQS